MEEQIVISKELYEKALGTMGDRIRMARMSAGFSQLGLAGVAGVSQNHISDLEYNKVKDPGLATLKRIAEATGVSLPFLMFDMGEADPSVRRALTPEAEKAAQIIDSLPEEERVICLDMVKAIRKRFVEGTKKNKKKANDLLVVIEQRHGREARQIIEDSLGVLLGSPQAMHNIKRERMMSEAL